MMIRKGRPVLAILLALVLSFGMHTSVPAATKGQLQQQKNDAQKKLDSANAEVSELSEEEARVQEEIDETNAQLVSLLASMDILQDEMTAKKEQISQAETDYDAAKQEEDTQYEAMKKRIRFMYEKGDTEYLELFLTATSIADALNKADFAEKIYDYDREMLEKYQESKQAAADLAEQLRLEESDLESMQDGYEEQQADLEDLLNNKMAEAEDFDARLAEAKSEAKSYEKQIKEANTEIAKIAAKEKAEAEAKKKAEEEAKKKAEEEAKRQAEEQQNSENNSEQTEDEQEEKSTPSVSGSGTGREIAEYALQFVGNPYVSGGTSLTNGTDCSGFTMSVYKHFGYSIPRTSGSQAMYGTSVSYENAQPGDIMCYPGHVAIYIGNGMIVHASTPATGIKTSIATYRPIMSIRRIVN